MFRFQLRGFKLRFKTSHKNCSVEAEITIVHINLFIFRALPRRLFSCSKRQGNFLNSISVRTKQNKTKQNQKRKLI